jgi:hypothetical protein
MSLLLVEAVEILTCFYFILLCFSLFIAFFFPGCKCFFISPLYSLSLSLPFTLSLLYSLSLSPSPSPSPSLPPLLPIDISCGFLFQIFFYLMQIISPFNAIGIFFVCVCIIKLTRMVV